MESTDVLVIGSGIAGLCAAIEAASAGATVAIASAGKTMSGSSFFPGTWGLGLIGPVDEDDEQDLIDTIQAVGGGVARPYARPDVCPRYSSGHPMARAGSRC